MLDRKLGHRKIARVSGRQAGADRDRSGGDQAIGLGKRAPAGGECAAPLTRAPALHLGQGNQSQAGEEPFRGVPFRRRESTHRLLDIDGTHVRTVAGAVEIGQPTARLRSTAEQIDDHGRVEQDRGHSTDPLGVRASLAADPPGRIGVPLVAAVLDRAER